MGNKKSKVHSQTSEMIVDERIGQPISTRKFIQYMIDISYLTSMNIDDVCDMVIYGNLERCRQELKHEKLKLKQFIKKYDICSVVITNAIIINIVNDFNKWVPKTYHNKFKGHKVQKLDYKNYIFDLNILLQ